MESWEMPPSGMERCGLMWIKYSDYVHRASTVVSKKVTSSFLENGWRVCYSEYQ